MSGKHLLFYMSAMIVTAIVAAVYLFNNASGASWAFDGLPLDDAWIHLVYARSLAEDGWFYYNAGVPEAGMSSPLWVIVLAMAYKVGIPLGLTAQWVAKGTSLLFAAATAIAGYHVTRALRLPTSLAWIAGLLILIDPNFSYSSVAGMEVTMAAFLLLLAVYANLTGRYILAGMVMGLLVITRAELVPAVIVMGGIPLLQQYLRRKNLTLMTPEELKLGLKLFLPSALFGGLFVLYNYSVNGTVFPNTYYVKRNFDLGHFNLDNLVNIWGGYGQYLYLLDGLLVVGVLIALGGIVWQAVRLRQLQPGILLLGVPLLQVYLFSTTIKVSDDGVLWTFFTRRYLDFLLPVLAIAVVYGTAILWQHAQAIKSRAVMMAVPLILLACIGFAGLNLVNLHLRLSETYSWDNENIEAVDVAMGRWLQENLASEAVLAVTDAGAMRYFANRDQVIIDLLGLNCHECIGQPAIELIGKFDPHYLVLFRQGYTDDMDIEELHTLSPQRVTILGGWELVAARRLGASLQVTQVSASDP